MFESLLHSDIVKFYFLLGVGSLNGYACNLNLCDVARIEITFGAPVILNLTAPGSQCIADNSAVSLMNCNREGNVSATIKGINFTQNRTTFTLHLGSALIPATDISESNQTQIVFLLPSNNGAGLPVIIMQTGGYINSFGPQISFQQCPLNSDPTTVECDCNMGYSVVSGFQRRF